MKQAFLIEIADRQNASWQGSVKWINGGKETNFRSALELIHLLDSAMEKNRFPSGEDGAKEEEA